MNFALRPHFANVSFLWFSLLALGGGLGSGPCCSSILVFSYRHHKLGCQLLVCDSWVVYDKKVHKRAFYVICMQSDTAAAVLSTAFNKRPYLLSSGAALIGLDVSVKRSRKTVTIKTSLSKRPVTFCLWLSMPRSLKKTFEKHQKQLLKSRLQTKSIKHLKCSF